MSIRQLIETHFGANYNEFRFMGYTFEIYGERPDAYTAYVTDETSLNRTELGHGLNFDEACELVHGEVFDLVTKEISRG